MLSYIKTLTNVRTLTILLFGFSSGLPLALTGSTLQAWFTTSHVDILTIGLLSLVGQPYIYKFLWAPLLDYIRLPFWGRRRGWLLVVQVALFITIISMSYLQPEKNAGLLALLALLTAFFSATQDIIADAYRAETLHSNELGFGVALFTTGYRIALLVSGGLALVLADRVGWHATYLLMAMLMMVGMLCCYFAPEPPNKETEQTPIKFHRAILDPLRELWSRQGIVAILIFIVLYKLGDAFAVSLLSNFLIHGVGFSLTVIGGIYKSVGMMATILGAILGGILLARIDLYRGLLWFGILQALSTLAYLILAIVGKNYSLMVAAIFIENFCAGMATDAFVALLMSLCHTRYTATQYALFAALSAVGRVYVGPIAAVVVKNLGWIDFFAWAFVCALPGLLLLYFLRTVIEANLSMIGE